MSSDIFSSANTLKKTDDLFDEDGWLRTGDIGEWGDDFLKIIEGRGGGVRRNLTGQRRLNKALILSGE